MTNPVMSSIMSEREKQILINHVFQVMTLMYIDFREVKPGIEFGILREFNKNLDKPFTEVELINVVRAYKERLKQCH